MYNIISLNSTHMHTHTHISSMNCVSESPEPLIVDTSIHKQISTFYSWKNNNKELK